MFDLSLNSGFFSFLLGILLESFCLNMVEFIYQVSFQSMHFLFNILKIQKIGLLHCLAFLSYESLSLA
jgi:hypothetical protein